MLNENTNGMRMRLYYHECTCVLTQTYFVVIHTQADRHSPRHTWMNHRDKRVVRAVFQMLYICLALALARQDSTVPAVLDFHLFCWFFTKTTLHRFNHFQGYSLPCNTKKWFRQCFINCLSLWKCVLQLNLNSYQGSAKPKIPVW